jgi:hypothetical protein
MFLCDTGKKFHEAHDYIYKILRSCGSYKVVRKVLNMKAGAVNNNSLCDENARFFPYNFHYNNT